jgi:(4-O-methyl)-D-glucuronate---lignin esterase
MTNPTQENRGETSVGGLEGEAYPVARGRLRLFAGVCILFLSCLPVGVRAQQEEDPLLRGFSSPPESAWPRVWWHWMNGNITKEGIKLDLEWMHRVGVGGFHIFDASLSTPQVVEKRLVYMTPEWKDAFSYAVTLGDKFGMEEAIASSPGWSETGGPWVPPSQGMKKYVWSETLVEGGKPYMGKLAHPPANTGPFQDFVERGGEGGPAGPQFYGDAAVIAYRRPAGDVPIESLHPRVTASGGSPDAAMLDEGCIGTPQKLPIPEEGKDAWIQYEFSEPQSMRSLTIAMNDPDYMTSIAMGISTPEKSLQASDDGRDFHVIVKLPDGGAPEHTVSFSPATARFFRVVFKRAPAPKAPSWMTALDIAARRAKGGLPPTDYIIVRLALHPGARVNRFEEKAAFTPFPDLYQFATPLFAGGEAVSRSDVLDLTASLRADGTLDWAPPPGDWVVLRFGYSLLGTTNHPATAEATGLEVDKLNAGYVKNYMDGYLDSFKEAVGTDWMGKRGIQYVVTDSWEAGSQNWTDDMIAKFKARRGYDPIPWLPVLAGRVVESAEASDRFLWDFRKTIADLISDEHYGQVEASLKERGMGHYGESHEGGRALVADGMEVKKLDDIPMSAMWTQHFGENKESYNYNADDRESASVAHIYGQNLAAAESMTASHAPWAWSPATLKPTADSELLNGINRFVIHESAHQPLVGKAPGLTLGPYGQWFNRNETWAEEAGPWVKYIARSSYLLQQGHFGADLVYFYGEDTNLTSLFTAKAPPVPAGYGFDYINADGLIHELFVDDGRIATKSGMSYRVLGLDPYSQHMSLPVLRAIHKLVVDGGVVAGRKPTDDPSLADDQAEFHRLADELFGNGSGLKKVGKGAVYAGWDLTDVFDALQVKPDFDYTKPESDTRILFAHRRLMDGDLYFVDNRNDRDESVDATFRVSGKEPELWHAETGAAEATSYKIANGLTTVPLRLEPWGAVFVVFRRPASDASRTLPAVTETPLATDSGPWNVAFQPGRGAPPSITLDVLSSWSDNPGSGVKYFSGTATYTKSINAPASWFSRDGRLWIDLGDVKNLAEVSVNGKSLGIVWHAPYRVDVTGELRTGANDVSIKVTNAWVNRLIGDQQPDAAVKYTFADIAPYKADSPLLPSGLLGPVRIYSVAKQ